MLHRSFWAALAVVLAGCKGGAPAPSAAFASCSTDAECPSQFRCDPGLRRCVCASDAACPDGQFCNAFTGACVASVGGCTADSACGKGEYCNTALRACKPITAFCRPCRIDAECGPGSACSADPDFPQAGAVCAPACGGSCAAGLTCKKAAKGSFCFPASACGSSNACVPDSLRPCSADSDCGEAAQTCDQSLKACVTRARTCPAGDACDPQSKLCVQVCASDDDCARIEGAAGYQCRANACFHRSLCAQDSDCSAGQICRQNPDGSKSCQAGCVAASDCPLAQGCDATSVPGHPRCAAGCTQNQDCPVNTICAGGACVGSQGGCAQTCQDTAACPIGSHCVSNCCASPSFSTICGATGCATCTVGGGCALDCASSCYPIFLGPCTSMSDCTARFGRVPGMVCFAGQCQVAAHLLPCAQDSDCPFKGFKCFPSCGGKTCTPFETAAVVACAQAR